MAGLQNGHFDFIFLNCRIERCSIIYNYTINTAQYQHIKKKNKS